MNIIKIYIKIICSNYFTLKNKNLVVHLFLIIDDIWWFKINYALYKIESRDKDKISLYAVSFVKKKTWIPLYSNFY